MEVPVTLTDPLDIDLDADERVTPMVNGPLRLAEMLADTATLL